MTTSFPSIGAPLPPGLRNALPPPQPRPQEEPRGGRPAVPKATAMPPGLLPRPPRHERRAHLRARRAQHQRSLPATSRPSAPTYDHPFDTPAQRRHHTERATRRVFGRVPTYLPRVRRDVLDTTASAPPAPGHDPAVATATSGGAADKAGPTVGFADTVMGGEEPRKMKKRSMTATEQKAEAQRKEMQLKRDRIAIREAFGVIDDDGGGSVEAPEVLKALKALGKKLDDKQFWSKFQKLCDEGEMIISAAQFEKLMLKMLEASRRKTALTQLGGTLLKEKPSASAYHARKRVQSLDSRVKHTMKNRLSKNRERKEFGDHQANVRNHRNETLASLDMAVLAQEAQGDEAAAPQKQKKKKKKKKTKADVVGGAPGALTLDGERAPTPVLPPADGSEWMVEALEQHRGLADIYTALTTLRSSTLQARIVDPPEDLR